MIQMTKIISTTLAISGKIIIPLEFIQIFWTYLAIIWLITGLLIYISLIIGLILSVYIFLYYLISKIDRILYKKKEFVLIGKKKFFFYVMKYLFIIISISFISFILQILLGLIPNEVLSLCSIIFNSLSMTFYWLSFILIFYIFIYFIIKKLPNIKDNALLLIYRFLVFFILRIILYILCPEEYTMYLSQGLISIFLFPDLISNIFSKIFNFFQFLTTLSPFVNGAEAEGTKFSDYINEKYPDGDPRRDPANYPRLITWTGIPPLSPISNFNTEELFYKAPAKENIFEEEYSLFFARRARTSQRLYSLEFREIGFMCSGGEEPWVMMPVFKKFYGMPTYPLPENYVAIQYENGHVDIFIFIEHRPVVNYIISENVFIIKPEGNRENYSPLFLWHLNKKIYLDNDGEGVLIGNSRGRVFDNKYLVKTFQEEFLREKYNIKRMTD